MLELLLSLGLNALHGSVLVKLLEEDLHLLATIPENQLGNNCGIDSGSHGRGDASTACMQDFDFNEAEKKIIKIEGLNNQYINI